MSDTKENQKTEIAAEIAALSKLLAMTPSDGTVDIREPMTDNAMALSDWLDTARDSLLKLSLLISKTLDIQLQ
jgi:hypothetical protein